MSFLSLVKKHNFIITQRALRATDMSQGKNKSAFIQNSKTPLCYTMVSAIHVKAGHYMAGGMEQISLDLLESLILVFPRKYKH